MFNPLSLWYLVMADQADYYIYVMKNSKCPFKYTLYSIANLAYLLSWPSVGYSLPLNTLHLLCAKLSKRVIYIHDLHLPVGQPLGSLLDSVLPRAVVLDKLLFACPIRIHSWNPHQLKRQTHPYTNSAGENLTRLKHLVPFQGM